MRRFVVLLCVLFASTCRAQEGPRPDSSAWATKPAAWNTLSADDRAHANQFADDYKAYLGSARSALTSTREFLARAKAAGFAEFTEASQVKPGARLIVPNRGRAFALVVIGSEPLVNGSRVVGTHQDSPHIELKGRPVYSSQGFALFKTIYYGGIKKYQWVNRPLALTGRIDTTDGRTVDISIGLKPGDPVFVIPDNAPHSDKELQNRSYKDVIEGEELEPVVGSVPGTNGASTSAEVIKILTSTYKIKEEDLVSSELSLVPADSPADVGIDRALIGSYGQDDRVSSYCAVRAILDRKDTPKYTSIAYVSNFEETGSINNTGAQSVFLNTVYGRLLGAQRGNSYSDLDLFRALHNSQVISADANDGINPVFPKTSEPTNAARVGYGVVIKLYGEGFNGTSEFIAHMRGILETNNIPYQTHTYKVDVGGGGTIGLFLSKQDMEVIDMGVTLLSMHSPFEMSSKADVFLFYRTMGAFFRQ